LVQAAIAIRQAQVRRYLAENLREQIAAPLEGRGGRSVGTAPTFEPVTAIAGFIERRASELAGQEVDAWWHEREQAAKE
jgi:hypothetical protein